MNRRARDQLAHQETKLLKAVIKLAYKLPELRPHLLPLLTASVKVTDKSKTKRYLSPNHNPRAVAEVQRVLSNIPSKLLSGLREVLVFPPEKASFYVEYGDGEYQANTRIVMVSSKPKLDTVAGIAAHEVGHHVANHVLSSEQRSFLGERLGWRTEEWNEDFASCFGFFFSGRKALAARTYPESYQVLMQLLG